MSFQINDGSILLMEARPDNAMANSNSFWSKVKTFVTPSAPPQAKPKQIGFPTNTAEAPNAIAFMTSVPLLIPPSIKTGIRLFTFFTI